MITIVNPKGNIIKPCAGRKVKVRPSP